MTVLGFLSGNMACSTTFNRSGARDRCFHLKNISPGETITSACLTARIVGFEYFAIWIFAMAIHILAWRPATSFLKEFQAVHREAWRNVSSLPMEDRLN